LSGLLAAYALSRHHDVALFEKNPEISKTKHTFKKDGATQKQSILYFSPDVTRSFYRTLSQLDLTTHKKKSSPYCLSYLNTFFHHPKKAFSKPYLRMLFEILCFPTRAKKDLLQQRFATQSIATYLNKYAYSETFIAEYFIPLTQTIVHTDRHEILALPAQKVLQTLKREGLLQHSCVRYQSIDYDAYVNAITTRWHAICHVNSAVLRVQRNVDTIQVQTATELRQFDYIIFAISADKTLKLLETPSDDEYKLLSEWSKEDPTNTSEDTAPTSPVETEQRPSRLSPETLHAQKELPRLNGKNRSFFCGNYFGLNPLEDEIASAIQVLHHFNCQL
jgi:uncharacterized protein